MKRLFSELLEHGPSILRAILGIPRVILRIASYQLRNRQSWRNSQSDSQCWAGPQEKDSHVHPISQSMFETWGGPCTQEWRPPAPFSVFRLHGNATLTHAQDHPPFSPDLPFLALLGFLLWREKNLGHGCLDRFARTKIQI